MNWILKIEQGVSYNTHGLYYKHITIVNYNSSIINKFAASLTDDPRVVIYDRHMFIVQATSGLLLGWRGVEEL
jgi:hypothetical protein